MTTPSEGLRLLFIQEHRPCYRTELLKNAKYYFSMWVRGKLTRRAALLSRLDSRQLMKTAQIVATEEIKKWQAYGGHLQGPNQYKKPRTAKPLKFKKEELPKPPDEAEAEEIRQFNNLFY